MIWRRLSMMKNEELDDLVKKLEEFWLSYDLESIDSYAIKKAIETVD